MEGVPLYKAIIVYTNNNKPNPIITHLSWLFFMTERIFQGMTIFVTAKIHIFQVYLFDVRVQ